MRDFWTFALSFPYQIAEVGSLIIEPTMGERLIEIHNPTVDVMNSGLSGIPPIGMEQNIAAWSAQEGVAAAEQVNTGVQLCHATFVFGLHEAKGIYAARGDAAHCLDSLEVSEPVQGEEPFIGSDAKNSAPSEFKKMQRVIGPDGGVAVTGSNETDRPDGVDGQVRAEFAI